ncbi:MAG TPA: hypothetical protein VJT67_07240 [Longimicrobiaceae bacterium]|nr:hypothetical protein [Longimicrobiaceae bacterium]
MRPRTLLGLGAIVAGAVLAVWDRTACWRLGHDPAPHPLRYFYCTRCPKKAYDLSGLGYGEGFVGGRRRA